MSLLPDVVNILVNASPSLGLTGATNLFYNKRPNEPDQVTALFRYAGVNQSFIGQTKAPGVQVTVRAEDTPGGYDTAEALIISIGDYLSKIGDEQRQGATDFPEGIEVNGTWYLRFQPVQDAFPLGEDESGRQLFAQNFIVTHRRN